MHGIKQKVCFTLSWSCLFLRCCVCPESCLHIKALVRALGKGGLDRQGILQPGKPGVEKLVSVALLFQIHP